MASSAALDFPRVEARIVRGLGSPGPEGEASNENHTRNGEVAKRLGNGLQNWIADTPLAGTEHRENKLESALVGGQSTPSKSDESQRSVTLENKGQTLLDDSRDMLGAALARALEFATASGRIDLVERILAQVERRRG